MERDPIVALAGRLQRVAELALDFLLPRTCVACDRLMDTGDARQGGLICGRCWNHLATLPHPQCERCGHPLRGRCQWCGSIPEYVAAIRSVCWMHIGSGATIVHALKYRGWHAVAREIAERMGRIFWPPDAGVEAAVLIPVPLAPSRERERGYNQSERIAAHLANRMRRRFCPDALERVRATQTQTRLTAEDRLANVSNAFRVREIRRHLVRNAGVLLVDDVITTGATLNACAAALHEGGARSIAYVTFGRAPAKDDKQGRDRLRP